MTPGAVGFQCPECVHEGRKQTRQGVLPYGGERSRDPRLTSMVLIAVNALVWVATIVFKGRAINLLAITPAGTCIQGNYIVSATQAQCLAGNLEWVPGVGSGAWWQVLTSAFTHIEVWHIFVNMFSLWILGPQLEQVFGRLRFLAIYLVSAVAGSALIMWFAHPNQSTLGASGAIFGLLGAILLVAHKHGGAVQQILMILGINVVITVLGGSFISWQGHLGGFLGGAAVTAALMYLPKSQRARWQWPLVALILVVALALIAVRAFQLA